mmetsp:Transcript_97328/g.256943  ORF Transcript_97328/g.256943 Transcript_97328/m.256943 type:complete len:346 (-) Transcript_97328:260-1297(-)
MGDDDKHASRREKILQESLESSNQPSWGYFGLGGSLAIGDNSYAPILKRRPKEEEEIAEPMRQIQCNPPKKGAGPDAFFTFETSIGLGDPYQDASYAIKKGRVQHLNPEAAFMPPGKIGWSVNKLGYEYIDHKDTAKDPKAIKEKYTDYMPPRQILTNPPKKGGGGTLTQGVLFGFGGERNAHPGYVEDDYNAPRKLRMKELEEHKSKLQEAPFKQNDHGYRNFQADQELFQQEPGSNVPREKKQVQLTKPYPHEVPFRPANPPKKGVPTKPVKEGETRDYLGGTYEYIGDPEVKTVRKPKSDEPEKAPFRGCVPKSFANPMPSVVCNTRNMRAERPSSFVRPSL